MKVEMTENQLHAAIRHLNVRQRRLAIAINGDGPRPLCWKKDLEEELNDVKDALRPLLHARNSLQNSEQEES